MVDNHDFHFVDIIEVLVNHPGQQHVVALLVGGGRVGIFGGAGCTPLGLFGDRWWWGLGAEIGQVGFEPL